MGYAAVKAAVVGHVSALLPSWVAREQVADWPPLPRHVAASEVWPEADASWPWVLVSSSGSKSALRSSAVGDGTLCRDYQVKVSVGLRARKDRDPDSVTAARDAYVEAVRWLLEVHPGLSSDVCVVRRDSIEETAEPLSVDEKSRLVALGSLDFVVTHTEAVPDPGASTDPSTAQVTVTAVAADKPL